MNDYDEARLFSSDEPDDSEYWTERDPYGYGGTDPDLIRRSGARLAYEYGLRHKWHIHTELPKKTVTPEELARIADILNEADIVFEVKRPESGEE